MPHLSRRPLFGASVGHASILISRMFSREASISGETAGSGGEGRGNAGTGRVPKAKRRALDIGVRLHPHLCSATGGAGGGFITTALHCP